MDHETGPFSDYGLGHAAGTGRLMAKPMRLLSIDGGGIRGVIPASVLVEVESMLQEREGPQARLVDHFDLFAGTSTGGLITGLLVLPEGARNGPGRPKLTARQILQLYLDQASTLFDRTVFERVARIGGLADERYPSEGFNEALDAMLGARDGPEPQPMLSDLLKPTVIPTYNASTSKPYFFKQHRARNGGLDFAVRDVALATAAAPTYFETAQVSSDQGEFGACVDGGIFANNPTMCAFVEAQSFGHRAEEMAVLSLGTGTAPETFAYEDMKDWGLGSWVKPLIDMMLSGADRTVDHQMRQIFGPLGEGQSGSQYLRLQADLSEEAASTALMDNADPDNLQRLVAIGREVADAHRTSLEWFIDTQLIGPGDEHGAVRD